jgi:hypothetical protein
MLKHKAKKYFKLFSNKDINGLSTIFSKKITLRDWKIKAEGLKKVLNENKKIFKNCKSIQVKPIKIFQEKKTIIAELHIRINKSKNLLVIDVIDFDKQYKIKSIRAYLGN